ncbi:MAG TPA: hypothetical protein VFY90_11025 [Tepidiformaceae bacterium]|nr:hypothetical protein [Tepidiformaceae bacterium]
MLRELQERLAVPEQRQEDLVDEVLRTEARASTAVELALAVVIGLVLGIALGLQMELRSQRVAKRVGSYRDAWQMLRGT